MFQGPAPRIEIHCCPGVTRRGREAGAEQLTGVEVLTWGRGAWGVGVGG
jgi:hypothetical protein